MGRKTESGLWERGIFDWDDLLRELPAVFRDTRRQESVREMLCDAEIALRKNDISFFARHLPDKEQWRLYRKFREKTVFLDIETTGLSPYYDSITVVGAHDASGTKIFLKDTNMNDLPGHLEKYAIIVTFNGKLFDVPFIRKFYPEISIPPVHLDLRFLLKSIGLAGPLKKTEKFLGIVRDASIQDIDGRQAVVLWNRFIRGDDASLRDLIRYNVADTVGLKNLMDFCYVKKLEEVCPPLKNEEIRSSLAGFPGSRISKEFFSGVPVPLPEIHIRRRPAGLELFLDGTDLLSVRRENIQKTVIALPSLLSRIEGRAGLPVSMGIDLTGSPERASGICVLRGADAHMSLLHSEEEIVAAAGSANPDVVAIDSSLGLPRGRCCVKDSCRCRCSGILRECERELKRRGINVYPCLIPSMQALTIRGMALAARLRTSGFTVIESYPGAVQDILGFPRKRVHLDELSIDLMNMGIVPHADRDPVSHDEIDALTNAVAGFFYLAGAYEAIGDPEEGLLIIPQPGDLQKKSTR